MDLSAYLNFNGNCAEAFRFYEQTLGGKIEFIQTHGESPLKDQFPPEWSGKIMHVRLRVGDRILMGSDAPPTHFSPASGFAVSIGVANRTDGERIFNALSDGGKVSMPFQKTYWSEGFGMLRDRFGIPWMVNSGVAGVQ
jgi:PhnB protein